MELNIRWLIRRDMPAVLEIERLVFEFPWTDDDFMSVLKQRNCIGMVADTGSLAVPGDIAGSMIYELHKNRLVLLNFAVAPRFQRKGVGRAMVEKLIDKLSQQRRQELLLEIRERNLDAQFFFREMGFKAIRVIRQCYEDTDEDCYVFRYRIPGAVDEPTIRNRGNAK
jgi:ribosomal-protein-alanine N-acetyltransferase